ncbi:MAG: type I DNA topoisomerase [Erysipelotrichaceae bacterium]
MKKLVIVESPSKSKTIEKYLGSDFEVVSSKGHIRDLATSGKGGLGIDIENNFEPTYKISPDKREIVKSLKKEAKKCSEVYLASDPDREGEAISWHLAQELGLDMEKQNRIIFNEITKSAVLAAFDHPRTIDQDMVKSQEVRRMLDRIIGFKLSKLLQSKIRSKSAGRVQSVALRLIVERENEIRAFNSEEYWSLQANIEKDKKAFVAQLSKVDGKKAELKNQEETDAIINRLSEDFIVSSIEKKVRKKEAKMPFITSTLQQEASTKLNFGAKRTMQIAQRLYEGIDLGGHSEGLISYMRTDSTRLSEVFVKDANTYIEETFGKAYIGRLRQKNSENAQDAHEAIRVTNVNNTPEKIKDHLTQEQYRLYKLIYVRTLASLMAPSKSDVVSVVIENNGCEFNASGSIITFNGYLKLYQEFENQKDELLPVLKEKEVLEDVEVEGKQHFTEPPLRYSEARLIKELEEKGIGRPSTYAMIIDTLQARGYVNLDKPSEGAKMKVFIPTDQGELTDQKLQEFFSEIINVMYTANMEEHLDEIANGTRDNIEELRSFYKQFEPLLEDAYEHMEKKELELTGDKCPECGSDLVYRVGRFGKFISCIDFPTCRYTKSEEAEDENGEVELCPKCGSKMVSKKGRYGAFLACSNYPECKYIKSNKVKEEPKPTGEMCPECGHELVERKSRFGTTFVGCSNYPACRYIKKDENKVKKEATKKATKKKTTKKTVKKVVKKKAVDKEV